VTDELLPVLFDSTRQAGSTAKTHPVLATRFRAMKDVILRHLPIIRIALPEADHNRFVVKSDA
jgi:hypothetical protein